MATWKRVAFSSDAGIGQKNASLTGGCGEAKSLCLKRKGKQRQQSCLIHNTL
jgi:hypothetical protein